MPVPMTSSKKPRRALRGLSRQDLALIGIPAAIAIAVLLWFAGEVVRPPPPSNLTMTAGAEGGAYARFAERYREVLARNGIHLTIKPSAGSIENVTRLLDPRSGVDVGFVQSGSISGPAAANLVSLGSLYYEPLWVFYRGDRVITRLSQLEGMRLAVGAPGSGTLHVVMEMLNAAGMARSSRVQLKELSTPQAAQALQSDEVDAAFFFASAEAPVVQQLLAAPQVKLMSWDRADAYARRFPFLAVVTLPSGVIDLEHDRPASDVKLLASTAELVARYGLHPALSDLLIEAAQQIHSGAGLLEGPGEFPALRESSIPLSDDAQRYYRSGKTFLNRYLPFWAATLVQRALVFLLPIVAVMIPMFKLVPPLYRWRVRSRVYRWYGDLMMLEHELHTDPDPGSSERHLKRLDWIEDKVNSTWPPLSFAEERYALLGHVRAVRQEIARQAERAQVQRQTARAEGSEKAQDG
jgi:TRAP transporter TAXI family solute receptor